MASSNPQTEKRDYAELIPTVDEIRAKPLTERELQRKIAAEKEKLEKEANACQNILRKVYNWLESNPRCRAETEVSFWISENEKCGVVHAKEILKSKGFICQIEKVHCPVSTVTLYVKAYW